MSKMFKSNETINQENKDSKVKKIFKEVFFSFSWLAIILLICDIITKVCAEKFLTGKGSVVVIPHLLNFTLTLFLHIITVLPQNIKLPSCNLFNFLSNVL